MGILSRFKDIMASNINAVFKKEDKHPEKTINKYLTQLKSDLGQVSAETEAIKMENQRARMALDENLSEQEKLQRYIDKASSSGNSSDARTYEARLERVKSEGETLQKRYDEVSKDMNNLTAMDEKLRADINTLENRLREIKSKEKNAKNTEQLLNAMDEKANYMMDKANALAELNKSATSDYDEVEELASKYEDSSDEQDD